MSLRFHAQDPKTGWLEFKTEGVVCSFWAYLTVEGPEPLCGWVLDRIETTFNHQRFFQESLRAKHNLYLVPRRVRVGENVAIDIEILYLPDKDDLPHDPEALLETFSKELPGGSVLLNGKEFLTRYKVSVVFDPQDLEQIMFDPERCRDG